MCRVTGARIRRIQSCAVVTVSGTQYSVELNHSVQSLNKSTLFVNNLELEIKEIALNSIYPGRCDKSHASSILKRPRIVNHTTVLLERSCCCRRCGCRLCRRRVCVCVCRWRWKIWIESNDLIHILGCKNIASIIEMNFVRCKHAFRPRSFSIPDLLNGPRCPFGRTDATQHVRANIETQFHRFRFRGPRRIFATIPFVQNIVRRKI